MASHEKLKKKHRGRGCLIALLVIVVILGVAGGIGWSFLAKEHREAANIPIAEINFSRLHDGAYHGAYAGGMYRWRYNECLVTVSQGKVTDIQLTAAGNLESETPGAEMLYDRVIQSQSLQVDTISGSTLTGKGYLKAVENALVQAEGK